MSCASISTSWKPVCDPVAYVRFASVYKNFRETRDFEQFLETLTPQEREEKDK